MKKLYFLIASQAFFFASQAQSVGIGTTTPDSTAILDIVSTNKGVLIPRIGDTTNVTDPVEGLIIYNKKTKTPYYFNGKNWLSLVGAPPGSLSASTDNITYEITGTGFRSTEFPVIAITQGVTNDGIPPLGAPKPTFADFSFIKKPDINSKTFNQRTIYYSPPPTVSIEFKLYAAGAATPYISYRLKNLLFTGIHTSVGGGAATFFESVSFTFTDYGFKDWVTNIGFNYNVATRVISAY